MKTAQIFLMGIFLVFISCGKKQEEKVEIPVKKVEKPVEVVKEEIIAQPLIFTVQIGAFEYGNNKIAAAKDVVTYKENNLFVYRFGSFSSYSEARKVRRNLLNTYPDAFVQAVKDGKRLAIEKALKSK